MPRAIINHSTIFGTQWLELPLLLEAAASGASARTAAGDLSVRQAWRS